MKTIVTFPFPLMGVSIAKVQAVIAAATISNYTVAAIEVECQGTSPAWPSSEGAGQLVNCWREAATRMGLKLVPINRGGLSDANYLCSLGPTLDGLGPDGANAHCSERSADGSKLPEYVDSDSFVPKAAMNVLAISELLREG